MATVTVKHGDTHDLKFQVSGTGIVTLSGASGVMHVKHRYSTTPALSAPVDLSGTTATWALDGTLPVGAYDLELELTVEGRIITAPSNGYLRLVVLPDLA